jgi:hypothetical protein
MPDSVLVPKDLLRLWLDRAEILRLQFIFSGV